MISELSAWGGRSPWPGSESACMTSNNGNRGCEAVLFIFLPNISGDRSILFHDRIGRGLSYYRRSCTKSPLESRYSSVFYFEDKTLAATHHKNYSCEFAVIQLLCFLGRYTFPSTADCSIALFLTRTLCLDQSASCTLIFHLGHRLTSRTAPDMLRRST